MYVFVCTVPKLLATKRRQRLKINWSSSIELVLFNEDAMLSPFFILMIRNYFWENPWKLTCVFLQKNKYNPIVYKCESMPPAATIVSPVMYEASSDTKKATTPDTWSTLPSFFIGMMASIFFSLASESYNWNQKIIWHIYYCYTRIYKIDKIWMKLYIFWKVGCDHSRCHAVYTNIVRY